MSLFRKLETDVEIKASPEKFYEMFRCKPHHVSTASPDKVKAAILNEGEWGAVGSILTWHYVHDGKDSVAKAIVEAVDDEKNLMTFKMIEGDVLELYKSFKATLQATAKGEGGGSVVHLTLEYEKKDDAIPESHTLLQLAVDISKDIDAHLTSGQ